VQEGEPSVFTTDRIIYLQLQKTACTHIAALLRQHFGGVQGVKHAPFVGSPPGKFFLGSVRDPWDWYVSLWAYGCSGRGSLFHQATTLGWRPVWRALVEHWAQPRKIYWALGDTSIDWRARRRWLDVYSDVRDPLRFRRWLAMMYAPEERRLLVEGYPQSSVSEFAGFLTYRYLGLYIRNDAWRAEGLRARNWDEITRLDAEHNLLDGAIRMENLTEDFIVQVRRAGHVIDDRMEAAIRDGGRRKSNTSEHADIAFYYDDTACELVRDHERLLVDKYAYAPPGGGR
jgi:hypothetical protein